MALVVPTLADHVPDREPMRESDPLEVRLPASKPGLMAASVYCNGRRVRDIRMATSGRQSPATSSGSACTSPPTS